MSIEPQTNGCAAEALGAFICTTIPSPGVRKVASRMTRSVSNSKPALLLLLSYLAFVSLGLPDTVFGVAWPSLRDGFGLSEAALGAVLGAGLIGYFCSGLVAGRLIGAMGVGGVVCTSSALVALALAAYALAPSWPTFFPVGALLGLGSGAIDAGLNAYAARHFSVRHVNWLHACWGIGASTGPLIMTAAIAHGWGYRGGYAALAGILGAMSVAFLYTRRLWSEGQSPGRSPPELAASAGADPATQPSAIPSQAPTSLGSASAALRRGRVWLQLAAFFLYTGLESTTGQWCFTLLRERHQLGIEGAGSWTSAYWASLTVGRIVLGGFADRFGPDRLLRWSSLGMLGGAALFALGSGAVGRSGLLLLGLSLAPVFPTLMARTPARLGDAVARHAIGFQVSAATLGSALLPSLTGVLVARFGLASAPLLGLGAGLGFFAVHECLLAATRTRPATGSSARDAR